MRVSALLGAVPPTPNIPPIIFLARDARGGKITMSNPTPERAALVPVRREIRADLETPVSAYLKVARGPYSYLLESVAGGESMARYSFIGVDPLEIVKTGAGEPLGAVDPLKPVEEMLSRYALADSDGAEKFNGGAVGYIAYDAVRHFETLPTPDADALGLPESVFMLSATYLVFDHLRQRITVVSHAVLWRRRGRRRGAARGERPHRRDNPPAGRPADNAGAESGIRNGRRHPLQHEPRALRRHGPQDARIHHRRRHNPGGRRPAHVARNLRPPLPNLPLPARHKPVALHVLSGFGRVPNSGRVP